MNKYYDLESNMSDRLNFDDFANECGYEGAKLDIETLLNNNVKELAEESWEAALNSDQIGYANTIENNNFLIAVNDIEEAKARWISAWSKGFESKKLNIMQEKVNEILQQNDFDLDQIDACYFSEKQINEFLQNPEKGLKEAKEYIESL